MDKLDRLLPPKPEEPFESDCCGTGCTPCVFDIYTEELKLWEKQCTSLNNAQSENTEIDGFSGSKQEEDVIRCDSYKEFEIINIVKESATIFRYRFGLSSHQWLPLTMGQHLILRWNSQSGCITRQYTPVSDCSESGYFDVSIKIYKDGRMSQYVNTWSVGDRIEWRGPFGNFTYKPNKHDTLVLLAAGTGIAPMVQVIRHILQNEDDDTMIKLFYSVKLYEDIMCKDMLDVWRDYWNFKVVYHITQGVESNTTVKYGEKIVYGRITEDQIQNELSTDSSSIYFCICGTKSFDKDMINILKDLGVKEENYHKF